MRCSDTVGHDAEDAVAEDGPTAANGEQADAESRRGEHLQEGTSIDISSPARPAADVQIFRRSLLQRQRLGIRSDKGWRTAEPEWPKQKCLRSIRQ